MVYYRSDRKSRGNRFDKLSQVVTGRVDKGNIHHVCRERLIEGLQLLRFCYFPVKPKRVFLRVDDDRHAVVKGYDQPVGSCGEDGAGFNGIPL
jgi:hypothetical protein